VTTSPSEPDRAVVREALEDIRAGRPADRTSTGCVVALPGFAILLVFPVAGRILGAGQGVATAVLVAGFAFLLVGMVLWFTAAGQRRRHAVAAAEAALRTLESGEDDRTVLLRAATLLLVHAQVPQGRDLAWTFDPVKARARIGGRMPLVGEVEGFLVEQAEIYPVFSDDGGASPS